MLVVYPGAVIAISGDINQRELDLLSSEPCWLDHNFVPTTQQFFGSG